MNSNQILQLLEKFEWFRLHGIRGIGHSSIIGFLALEWIRQSPENTVLDGAPSPNVGTGRKGQVNADLLLCCDNKIVIPVEVETGVDQYVKKLESLKLYKAACPDTISFGLLLMANCTKCNPDYKYKHNWTSVKELAKKG